MRWWPRERDGNVPSNYLADPPEPRGIPQVWLAAGIALLFGALVAAALAYLRSEALRGSAKLTRSFTHVIAEQTARTVQTIDQRLQLVASELQAMSPRERADQIRVRDALQARLAGQRFVRTLWLLDPQGHVVAQAGEGDIGVLPTEHDHVAPYRNGAVSDFHVAEPVRSRASGNWLLTGAWPLRSASGALDGVVVAAIEPAYLREIWQPIDLGADGAIALFHRGGRMAARNPVAPRTVGRDFSALPLFRALLPRSDEGIYMVPSRVDGVERLFGYRVLPQYPQLLVVVGTSTAELLAPWRRFAYLTAAVWLCAVAIAAALALQVRRQARRRRQSEHRFRELAHAMPQIVFITDTHGRVQFVNRRWSEATGRPAAAALGFTWHQLAHPDDVRGTAATIAAAVAAGQPVQSELRLRAADGADRWQLARAAPVRDESGRVTAWYGTSTDIDALKLAQDRLARQAELLSMAGQLARLGGWIIDPASGRITWSDEAAAILDMPGNSSPTAAEMIEMLDPAVRAGVTEALRRCAEDGTPFDLEVEITTPAGRSVWLRSIGQAVRDAAGNVVRLQGAQQDITPRVRMMAEIQALNIGLEERVAQRTRELAQQEALFRTLAEQAPQPIWMVDAGGAATFFSRAWYELVGGAAPRWLGDEWLALLHPDDVGAFRRSWAEGAREGHVVEGRRRLRARDGTWHTTIYRASAVRNEQGAIGFWVGVENDITPLMANQEALRLANEQLEAFSSSVSHDLQAPLQRIGSFAQLLERELAGAAPVGKTAHYAQRIEANVELMQQIITGMLSLSRASRVAIVSGTINLSELATEILVQLAADQPARQVHWQVEPGLAAQGDARLIRSVLENLLGNAWKFSAPRPEAEIVVGAVPERGEFFVRDNGAGFDMAHAGRLFGAFERLHRQDEFPGTGIGLATVARIVARHGGQIRAEAQPGRGATFFFTLPAPPATP